MAIQLYKEMIQLEASSKNGSAYTKSLSILSHKGGVGKTSIAANIAVHLAKVGHNVCLLDTDFHGPSIITFFKKSSDTKWLNDYLLKDEPLDNCLEEVSSQLEIPGKLFVGFADPSASAIETNIRINEQMSFKMLKNLMKVGKRLESSPYEVTYLILDSSPGTTYSTVNAMITTQASLFIVKLSNADLLGTSQMIAGLNKQLKNKSLVLANLIPKSVIQDEAIISNLQSLIENKFSQDIQDKYVDFIGWIPIDESLIQTEFLEAVKTLQNKNSSRLIYTLKQPDHLFSTTLVGLIPIIFEEND
ncbi:MAG: ParA family protein [Candidatus Hodarchaeales archaeon]